ncbi:MAG: 3,4-dihydroxy-2-butanone-4-phosphate synthase [Hyphomicrobiales bacterium]|nr:3,4-dihydroxy-2-butanone-4-phosphate synthase [Hyphomicrobiales bacterium]
MLEIANADWTRVQHAIRAFAAGEMVVVVDDDDRENEGDLIVAASAVTPEQMAFIVRHTSGIVCTPMTVSEARRLKLDPMVAVNDAPHSTAFTVSVDYRHGVTTGISAEERTATVRALANNNCNADDFVRPGHVFPLIAKEGGVLMRSGHTEAAVDLCRLAGLPEVAAICELVNDDGTVKRGDDVAGFAETHGFKMVSVAELIAYRQARERLVDRVCEFETETPAGMAKAIVYATPFDQAQHLALVYGDIADGHDVAVRLHREAILSDVFGDRHGLTEAMARIKEEGRGAIIYLRDNAAGVAPVSIGPSPDGIENEREAAGRARAREEQWREVGLGAQILKDLGISSIRLLTSRTRHYVGLSGFGIAIANTVFIEG